MGMRKVDFAAELLDVTEQRVYELVRKGWFPPNVVTRLGERQIRFNEEALLDWVARGCPRTPAANNVNDASAVA